MLLERPLTSLTLSLQRFCVTKGCFRVTHKVLIFDRTVRVNVIALTWLPERRIA